MHRILKSLPGLVMTLDKNHKITWINRLVVEVRMEDVMGAPAVAFVMPEYREIATKAFDYSFRTGKPTTYETQSSVSDDQPLFFKVYVGPILRGGEVTAVTLVTDDITERKLLEARLRESVEQLKGYAEELEEKNKLLAEENAERERTEHELRRQQAVVSALSTPIIQAWEGVLVLPIVGALDSTRASQMMEKLLAEIVRTRARFAVLDLTGVDTVDTSTVAHLLNVARAAGLLGSRCLVSGISPAIAQTMVSIGSDADAFMTFGQMQDALRYALVHEGVRSTGGRR